MFVAFLLKKAHKCLCNFSHFNSNCVFFLAQICTLNSILYVKRTCKTHFEPSGMVPDGAENHLFVLKWIQIESPFNSNQILISFYRFIIVMTGELIFCFFFFFCVPPIRMWVDHTEMLRNEQKLVVIVLALNTHWIRSLKNRAKNYHPYFIRTDFWISFFFLSETFQYGTISLFCKYSILLSRSQPQ